MTELVFLTQSPDTLSGRALDWAVAKALGRNFVWIDSADEFGEWDLEDSCAFEPLPRYSEQWQHGGPVLDKFQICVDSRELPIRTSIGWVPVLGLELHRAQGPTVLISAMRCFVLSKLGRQVEVPDTQALGVEKVSSV